MRNKILLIIVIILSYFAVQISFNKKEIEKEVGKANDVEVTLLDKKTNKLQNLNLEDYIVGVVAAEMPASFNMEALKAQAIVARSYAVYKVNTSTKEYDLLTDISNQSYIDKTKMQEKWQGDFEKYYQKITEAVETTKNKVLTYDGEVICAFYFAMSNGYTEDAALVFGNKEDYIESVDSSWDRDVKNFEVSTRISRQKFCTKLNIDCSEIKIGKINYSKTGRVNTIQINDQEFLGTKVRSLLGLRSTDFNIIVGDEITITTKGYGHGVGMSQYGANEMAKLGKNYEEILHYYYKDVTIQEINV